jgi:hypothetical protein
MTARTPPAAVAASHALVVIEENGMVVSALKTARRSNSLGHDVSVDIYFAPLWSICSQRLVGLIGGLLVRRRRIIPLPKKSFESHATKFLICDAGTAGGVFRTCTARAAA